MSDQSVQSIIVLEAFNGLLYVTKSDLCIRWFNELRKFTPCYFGKMLWIIQYPWFALYMPRRLVKFPLSRNRKNIEKYLAEQKYFFASNACTKASNTWNATELGKFDTVRLELRKCYNGKEFFINIFGCFGCFAVSEWKDLLTVALALKLFMLDV